VLLLSLLASLPSLHFPSFFPSFSFTIHLGLCPSLPSLYLLFLSSFHIVLILLLFVSLSVIVGVLLASLASFHLSQASSEGDFILSVTDMDEKPNQMLKFNPNNASDVYQIVSYPYLEFTTAVAGMFPFCSGAGCRLDFVECSYKIPFVA
jgi:hypothetical protein